MDQDETQKEADEAPSKKGRFEGCKDVKIDDGGRENQDEGTREDEDAPIKESLIVASPEERELGKEGSQNDAEEEEGGFEGSEDVKTEDGNGEKQDEGNEEGKEAPREALPTVDSPELGERGNQDDTEKESADFRSKKGEFQGRESDDKKTELGEGEKDHKETEEEESSMADEEAPSKESLIIDSAEVGNKDEDSGQSSIGKEAEVDMKTSTTGKMADNLISEETPVKNEDKQSCNQGIEIGNNAVDTNNALREGNVETDEKRMTGLNDGDSSSPETQACDGETQEGRSEGINLSQANCTEESNGDCPKNELDRDITDKESVGAKQEKLEEVMEEYNTAEEVKRDDEEGDGSFVRDREEKKKEIEEEYTERQDNRDAESSIGTPLIESTVFDEKESKDSTRNATGRRLTFPEKLYELLKVNDCQDAICWLPNGNAFALHPTIFIKKILPKHFEGTKFESFTRKLNRWGFKRIAGEDAPENTFAYSHHLFKRDYPELCRGMSGGKKMEQDFSHLIRYREREKLLNAAATSPGGIVGNQQFGFGGIPGTQPGMIGMGGVVGMNGMGSMGQMSQMGMGLHPGLDQQAQLQNLLFERQLAAGGMGGVQYGAFGGAGGLEREIALREMLLRQEGAAGNQGAMMQQQGISFNNNFASPGAPGVTMGATEMQQMGNANFNVSSFNAQFGNMQQATMMGTSGTQGMMNIGLQGLSQDANMGAPDPIGGQQSMKGVYSDPMKLHQQVHMQNFSTQGSGDNVENGGLHSDESTAHGQFQL